MKKLIALLLAVLMVLSLAACAAKTTTKTTGDGEIKRITVTVVHSDGSTKEFNYVTTEEFLGALLQEEGVIEGNVGPYGLEMTVVDGEQAIYNTDKAYWALYEGEEYALQGVDTTPIVDGRTYKLEYTRG